MITIGTLAHYVRQGDMTIADAQRILTNQGESSEAHLALDSALGRDWSDH